VPEARHCPDADDPSPKRGGRHRRAAPRRRPTVEGVGLAVRSVDLLYRAGSSLQKHETPGAEGLHRGFVEFVDWLAHLFA
jgi:hypothetical protein